jgi:predicted nucleic-acid-binding Zn-ribbon protein
MMCFILKSCSKCINGYFENKYIIMTKKKRSRVLKIEMGTFRKSPVNVSTLNP